MTAEVDALAAVLLDGVGSSGLGLRKAKVQNVAAPVATIRLGGSTTDVPGVRYLASYAPAAGDVVFVLIDGPALLILGKLA